MKNCSDGPPKHGYVSPPGVWHAGGIFFWGYASPAAMTVVFTRDGSVNVPLDDAQADGRAVMRSVPDFAVPGLTPPGLSDPTHVTRLRTPGPFCYTKDRQARTEGNSWSIATVSGANCQP